MDGTYTFNVVVPLIVAHFLGGERCMTKSRGKSNKIQNDIRLLGSSFHLRFSPITYAQIRTDDVCCLFQN